MATIYSLTNKIIQNLKNVEINIPNSNKKLLLIEDCKHTPRTGKAVRIDAFNLLLPKRSIYDHIQYSAFIADLFKDFVDLKINENKCAYFFASHEFAESIIGDVPRFTGEEFAPFYNLPNPELSEEEADKLILKFIPKEYLKEFKNVLALKLEKPSPISEEAKFVWMIDKIDPIISIYRMIDQLKMEIEDIDLFIKAMNDFFANPNVIKYCFSETIFNLISVLQNKDLARSFYFDKNKTIIRISELTKIDIKVFKLLFAPRMHFVD